MVVCGVFRLRLSQVAVSLLNLTAVYSVAVQELSVGRVDQVSQLLIVVGPVASVASVVDGVVGQVVSV